jgi:hypothetical protein
MKAAPPRDRGSFEQMDVHQVLEKRLRFRGTDVSENGSHGPSEIGPGDEAEAAKQACGRRIQVPVS